MTTECLNAVDVLKQVEWSGKVVLGSGASRPCCPHCGEEPRYGHLVEETGDGWKFCALAEFLDSPVCCPDCEGYGQQDCPHCGGSGGGVDPETRCPYCGGSGVVGPCRTCEGEGKVKPSHLITTRRTTA
jgi:hypothetical protein